MHPCYKMKYFKDAKWEQPWIDTAKTTTHNFFVQHYLSKVEQQEARSDTPSPQVFGYRLTVILPF
jgi:hypothetical protein